MFVNVLLEIDTQHTVPGDVSHALLEHLTGQAATIQGRRPIKTQDEREVAWEPYTVNLAIVKAHYPGDDASEEP